MPIPTCHVIWRATIRADNEEAAGYELPGQSGRHDEAAFRTWLASRKLAGVRRLSVSVLVIREYLDSAGTLHEGVLERRRGAVDGPYDHTLARVEFGTAGTATRCFHSSRMGRLELIPPERDGGPSGLADDLDPESFAGEDAAVHATFGPGTTILARRAVTPGEGKLGLERVIHARAPDGREVACGVGWHGTMAYVLAAAFPRIAGPAAAKPGFDAAVRVALMAHDLIRHETRLDHQGIHVIARRRGRLALVQIRPEGPGVRIQPYSPGRVAAANEDQRRWMLYIETVEGRLVIDSWQTGSEGEIAALTLDREREAWRHLIDIDGIEVGRHVDNEAAAAVLHRENAWPLDDDPAQGEGVDPEGADLSGHVLTRVRTFLRLISSLRLVAGAYRADAPISPHEILDRLRALLAPARWLNARSFPIDLRRLSRKVSSGTMTKADFDGALEDILSRLRDELAWIRIVPPPGAARPFVPGPVPRGRFEAHFPSAAYDIEEAVHSLARGFPEEAVRRTGLVLCQGLSVMERALAAPPLAGLSWTRIIAACRTLAPDHPDLASRLTDVRAAWRRPGLKAAPSYTEVEAEVVLSAAVEFMGALVTYLDQHGVPPSR